MRLLFVSTPVGPLGSGIGGGVELNLLNLAQALVQAGEEVTLIAPEGSKLACAKRGLVCIEVPGAPPELAQNQTRQEPIVLMDPSLLTNLWEQVKALELDYDLIVNWGYDWLPFYLTRFFKRPVAHIVSMGSLSDAVDERLAQVSAHFPGTVAVHSQAQAQTFPFAQDLVVLPCGMDLTQYDFNPKPQSRLAWVGRITPEKGLEDALAVAAKTGKPLDLMGYLQDEPYYQQCLAAYPQAEVVFHGFLTTRKMQTILRESQALLVTPKWVEAFGNVAVEALACGVPVLTYDRGGPQEIMLDGVTGFVTPADDIEAMVRALGRIDLIDRKQCRQRAEQEFSLEAMTHRFGTWFRQILEAS
jgi:UDP-glucose:tetrahydrobiopterin glucosyltransferase